MQPILRKKADFFADFLRNYSKFFGFWLFPGNSTHSISCYRKIRKAASLNRSLPKNRTCGRIFQPPLPFSDAASAHYGVKPCAERSFTGPLRSAASLNTMRQWPTRTGMRCHTPGPQRFLGSAGCFLRHASAGGHALRKYTSNATVSGARRLRFCVATCPATEKMRSDGADVAGMHSTRRANFASCGNSVACVFHHSSGLVCFLLASAWAAFGSFLSPAAPRR